MKTRKKQPATPRLKKCLAPDCDGFDEGRRGLCANCYAQALRLIELGKVTREELVERGLMLPSRQGLRPGALSKLFRK